MPRMPSSHQPSLSSHQPSLCLTVLQHIICSCCSTSSVHAAVHHLPVLQYIIVRQHYLRKGDDANYWRELHLPRRSVRHNTPPRLAQLLKQLQKSGRHKAQVGLAAMRCDMPAPLSTLSGSTSCMSLAASGYHVAGHLSRHTPQQTHTSADTHLSRHTPQQTHTSADTHLSRHTPQQTHTSSLGLTPAVHTTLQGTGDDTSSLKRTLTSMMSKIVPSSFASHKAATSEEPSIELPPGPVREDTAAARWGPVAACQGAGPECAASCWPHVL
jgi:hypothetical protein